MVKEKRQRAILDIIANHMIETQEQLLAELKERGFRCTQATISRDMKELQLIKELTPTGSYRYAVSIHQNRRDFNDRLRNVFREGVTSVDLAHRPQDHAWPCQRRSGGTGRHGHRRNGRFPRWGRHGAAGHAHQSGGRAVLQ